MNWQLNSYAFALIVCAVVSGAIALYAWSRRPATTATLLTLLMLAVTVWSLGYAVELGYTDFATKLLWVKFQYFGIAVAPTLMLLIVVVHTGHEQWLTRRNLALLSLQPLALLLLVWTNESHHLIWSRVGLVTLGSIVTVDLEHGLAFSLLSAGYAYFLFMITLALLVRAILRSRYLPRAQNIVLLLGLLVSWSGNLLYLLRWNPWPALDLTSFSATLAGLPLAWGLFRYRLLDLVPFARDIVIERLPDGVLVLDDQGRVVDLNPAAQKLIGQPVATIVNRPLSQVLPHWPDLVERYRDQDSAHELVVVEEGGQSFYYDVRITSLVGRQGERQGRVLTWRDITLQKQIEADLRASQKQLEAQNIQLRQLTQAVEQSANAVVITNLTGVIEYINPKFVEMTGYTPEEALGQTLNILRASEHDQGLYRDMWYTIMGGREWHGVLRSKRRDGTLYWERMTIAPVYDDAGQMTHYIAIKEDITAQKEAEIALQEYMRELEARNAELDSFSHTVAHDLKNLLVTTTGFADLLERKHSLMSEEQRVEFAHTIVRNGRKMANIIDELLLLARVRWLDEVETDPVDVGATVAEARRRLVDMIAEYQGEITQSDFWPVAIGYAPWIEEVWVNYISNALKYGGRPPHVQLGAEELPDGMVRFWVKDDGQGLTEEEMGRLFQPFTRLDQIRIKGYGLGLSIVHRIVERMGGKVGVESIPGQGSTFSFTLHGVPHGG